MDSRRHCSAKHFRTKRIRHRKTTSSSYGTAAHYTMRWQIAPRTVILRAVYRGSGDSSSSEKRNLLQILPAKGYLSQADKHLGESSPYINGRLGAGLLSGLTHAVDFGKKYRSIRAFKREAKAGRCSSQNSPCC